MKIINTINLNEARKQIQKFKKEKKEVIIFSQDNEFNRKILEIPDVDVLMSLELHNRKDRMKQRESGLNEIHCKLAKKNNIKIGIDLSKIAKLSKKEKAIVLARTIQNISLCKRVGTKIIIFPKKYNKQDIISLFLTLKSSTQLAKKAF